MTLEKFRSMLGGCTVINVALLLLWSGTFLFAHDWMFQLHSRWGFKLTPEVFEAMHYGGLGIYKLAIWLLNLAPCVACGSWDANTTWQSVPSTPCAGTRPWGGWSYIDAGR